MTHHLKEAARLLRLSGLSASLDLRLQEATSHQLPHAQFLELLLQDELQVRDQRRLERRKKAAGCPCGVVSNTARAVSTP